MEASKNLTLNVTTESYSKMLKAISAQLSIA
jgi:hypothetical protein